MRTAALSALCSRSNPLHPIISHDFCARAEKIEVFLNLLTFCPISFSPKLACSSPSSATSFLARARLSTCLRTQITSSIWSCPKTNPDGLFRPITATSTRKSLSSFRPVAQQMCRLEKTSTAISPPNHELRIHAPRLMRGKKSLPLHSYIRTCIMSEHSGRGRLGSCS
jgi:hypothetical protein